MVLTDASIWLPILFCHFFIKFPNSHRLSWAQAPPGQLQVFLSRFSALFVQRLKILWQSHLTWSTAGVSSQKRARALSLLIKILDLEISLIQTKIHSLMLSSNSFPTTHTHTDKISNQNIRPLNPLSREKLLFGKAPTHTAYWIHVIDSDFFSSWAPFPHSRKFTSSILRTGQWSHPYNLFWAAC